MRTRKEMSKVDAHWEVIPKIIALRDQIAPQTLITINGDIPDRRTGEELAEKYGVDWHHDWPGDFQKSLCI